MWAPGWISCGEVRFILGDLIELGCVVRAKWKLHTDVRRSTSA